MFALSKFADKMSMMSLKGEGEGEVAFFSAKRRDRRNRADLIESAIPCHDALVVGPYRDSNPLRLTVLAAMSGDYTTAPQHLQRAHYDWKNSTDHVQSNFIFLNEAAGRGSYLEVQPQVNPLIFDRVML